MTPEDKDAAQRILDAAGTDDRALVAAVWSFYHAADPASREPSAMYLHIGMLCGALMRRLETEARP